MKIFNRAVRSGLAFVVLASALAAAPALAQERVSRARLLEAMRSQTGYDRTKVTNAGRFQSGVYLDLARKAELEGRATELFLHHDDWFAAYLEAIEIPREEAPVWIRLPWEHRQDTLVVWDRRRVIERLEEGPLLRQALNVMLWWDEGEKSASEFEFEDRLSDPAILVRNERMVHFRLLQFDQFAMFDEVEGTRIRPLTGGLGVLFRIIGLASVDQVRFTPGPRGVSVVRGRGSKLFMSVATDVVVHADGRALDGIPGDRPDLRELAERLHHGLEIHYAEVDWEALARRAARLR